MRDIDDQDAPNEGGDRTVLADFIIPEDDWIDDIIDIVVCKRRRLVERSQVD